MEAPPTAPDLKEERWSSGKEAVAAIKRVALLHGKQARVVKKGGTFRCLECSSAPLCGWTVKLSRFRRKEGPGDWHVTLVDLNHRNCHGTARPTKDQVSAHPVVRAAVAANISVSAHSLVTQLRHQAGVTCSNSMMYRAKQTIHSDMFAEDPMTIAMLPSFLSKFQEQNTGTFIELEHDHTGHFRRAIIILNPDWFATGQSLYGVDAAHMKHRKYNGVQIVVVGRDGNLNNRVAAVALVTGEDHDNCHWFFSRLLSHGFPLTNVPVFTDRHKGIISATSELGIFNMFCVRHIIGNMRSDKAVRLPVSQEKFVWAANAADTEVDFNFNLDALATVNASAAEYLRKIPAANWSLYSHYKVTRLYGWRTTNFVESEQARSLKLKPRLMLPFEFFQSYATIMMGEAKTRAKLADRWKSEDRVLTPRAENKLQQEIRDAACYSVNFSSDSVAFVARVNAPLKQRCAELVAGKPTCSCAVWVQHGIACRHIVAMSQQENIASSVVSMVADCYKVARYSLSVMPIEVPEHAGLERDDYLLPTLFQKQAGRPRKRRIRSRGETGRARKVYKCGRCGKADGHNSATCKVIA